MHEYLNINNTVTKTDIRYNFALKEYAKTIFSCFNKSTYIFS